MNAYIISVSTYIYVWMYVCIDQLTGGGGTGRFVIAIVISASEDKRESALVSEL